MKQYQSDQWTLNDTLGLSNAADQVVNIALAVEPPFTIGVIGKWGSGKTSILKRSYFLMGGQPLSQSVLLDTPKTEHFDEAAKTELEQHQNNLFDSDRIKKLRCVWYSPWQYQNETNPLLALLKEIRSQFTHWQQLKDEMSTFNRRGALAALALLEKGIDAAATFTFQKNVNVASGTSKAVKEAWQQAEPDVMALSDGQRFHLLFEDAVQTVLNVSNDADDSDEDDPDAKLVIFIDDLDRCEGEQVVRLLEAIKLYLSCSKCVFVLGIDESAVLGALRHHWPRGDEVNREYLEKLFQSRIFVPLPAKDKIIETIKNQLDTHDDIKPYSEQLAIHIEKLCEPNPRKVKNFTNSFCTMWQVLNVSSWVSDDYIAQRFLIFQYLRLYHGAVYRILERQPESFIHLLDVLNNTGAIEAAEEGQRLLRDMFYRAFSHVLDHNSDNEDDKDKHGSESIDSAVDQFLQRQDRKRSDEYLKQLLKEAFTPEQLNINYFFSTVPAKDKS
ncbi:MAG: putative KAP-like P-loop ATPase [Phenylobacterium sp.]|jgi:predicted KAP-like P-loop ATPase